jgi:hypothetical protein
MSNEFSHVEGIVLFLPIVDYSQWKKHNSIYETALRF